jgi:hypothetical protein
MQLDSPKEHDRVQTARLQGETLQVNRPTTTVHQARKPTRHIYQQLYEVPGEKEQIQ